MSSGVVRSREEIIAAYDGLQAAFDTVAGLSLDVLTHPELLHVLDRQEGIARRWPTLAHPIIARLVAEGSPVELGAKSWREVLRLRLRISGADAGRRLDEAKDLGPRTAVSGEPLDPVLARTAAAQAAGTIGAEAVKHIRGFFAALPHWVDLTTKDQAEADLVRAAEGLDPDGLRKVAGRLAAMIDQDGPQPDDAERARKRCITLGRQGPDGMSKLNGLLDPQARAIWEAIQAKLGAPGMCNPDDEDPCVSGTPSQAQIQGDTRTPGQRHHDAFTAIGRNALCSGELGQHNGLPVTIIVSTTLTELESAAGSAVTGGGSLLPMTDLIAMAAHARHYLVVYGNNQEISLYRGRDQRLASPGQRLVLHSRDRGCTRPGCTVAGYHTQVHHTNGWKNNGQTNIDELTLACPADNRMVEYGWVTRIRNGQTEWIPPPHLDTGQTRTNTYHHPHRMLCQPDPKSDDSV